MSTDTQHAPSTTTTSGRPDVGEVGRGKQTAPWALVALRELQVKLTDRNFLIGTGAMLLLIIGSFALQGFLTGGGAQSFRVAVTESSAPTVVAAAQAELQKDEADSTVAAVEFADATAAQRALSDGDVDAALIPTSGGWDLLTDGEGDGGLQGAIMEAARSTALEENAAEAGTTVPELMAGTQVTPRDISGGDDQSRFIAWLAGFAMAFLFYMTAIMFGMAIASSVVEEKQSRIVEILAAAIPVRSLLTGKVLGNTALAFGQMAIIGAVALVGLSFTEFDQYLSVLTQGFLWYIPFFILGFLALACIWAAAGAMASRTEDLQSTTMPLTMALVLVFIVGLSLDGAAKVIGSFVPVLSTILMPMRLLEGTAQWWEAVLALGLTAAFCVLTIGIGTRLYRRALLQNSGRVSLKSAWAGGE